MERNTVIAFVILQLILISSLIVIATNEKDTKLNEQNDTLCLQNNGDCSKTCSGTGQGTNENPKLCEESCVQSRNNINNCDRTCNGSGTCGQDQNTETCKSSSACSNKCLG